jgi:hypothetical protein
MPVIPLYTPAPTPLDSHHVISPGGYEWWRFVVEHPGNGWSAILDVFDGHPFNDEYRRAYAHYRRRPTRNAPPQPSQYPFTEFKLQRRGQPTAAFQAQCLPEGFRSAELLQPDGSVLLSCSLAKRFSVLLRFIPREKWCDRRDADVTSPPCDVRGRVILDDPGETTELDGAAGSIKHRFGTEPIEWQG